MLALTLVTLAYHPRGWPSHTLAEAQGLRMLGPHQAELGELLRPTLTPPPVTPPPEQVPG